MPNPAANSRQPLAIRLLAWFAAVALRGLGATWRIRQSGPDPFGSADAPILGAFWHRNLLIAAYRFRDRGFSAPVSRSRDGDRISATLARLGYARAPRGSSSRGGAAALRGLVRLVRSGTTISIQPDGPRGPARTSKPGIISLARLTGAPIHPIGFSAQPCIRFRSWDGTLLPLPFARVVCEFGPALRVPADLSPDDEASASRELDRQLNAITDRLDAATGLRDRTRSSTD